MLAIELLKKRYTARMADAFDRIVDAYWCDFEAWPRTTRDCSQLKALLKQLDVLLVEAESPEPSWAAQARQLRQVMKTELQLIQQVKAEGSYFTELEVLCMVMHLLYLRGRRSSSWIVLAELLDEARKLRRKMREVTSGILRPLAQKLVQEAARQVDELALFLNHAADATPVLPHTLRLRTEAVCERGELAMADQLTRELALAANTVFDRDGSLPATELSALCDELAEIHAAMWQLGQEIRIERNECNQQIVRKRLLGMETRLAKLPRPATSV